MQGNSGDPDNVKLVRYTSGVNSSTTTMISGPDVGNNYASIQVTFAQATNTWELFVRDDGASAFADPTTLGAGDSQGTLVNNSHTALDLIYVGCYYAHATGASEVGEFDNVCIAVTAPCTAPTSQPSGLTFSAVTTTSMTVNWSGNGNGDGRIIVARAGSAVTAVPVSGNSYTASSLFGSGSDLGTSEYCVFRSISGSSVNVTGLDPDVTYHFAIFEYNTVDNCYFLTSPLTGSQATTCGEPVNAASNITFSNVTTTTMDINWTNGGANNRLVVVSTSAITSAEEPVDGTTYTANTIYSSGTAIGASYVVYAGTGNSVAVTGLTINTLYYIAVYEFNTCTGSEDYLISTYPTGSQSTYCAAPASAFFQGFESGAGDTWSITDGSVEIGTNSARTGTKGWEVGGNDTQTLELASTSTAGYINSTLTINVSAVNEDLTDSLKVYVNLNGTGFPTSPDVILLGSSAGNSDWAYNVDLTASTTAGTPIVKTSAQGGNNANNHSLISITIPDNTSSIGLKVIAINNQSTERWYLDDIDFQGCLTSSVSTGTITDPFCVTASSGASATVPYTSTGSFSSNTYTAQLSNSSGSFASPTNIGTDVSDANSGSISATIPAGTASGTGYRIRVISSSPALTGTDNGTNLSVVNGASNVTLTPISDENGQVTINWTNPTACFTEVLIVGKANGSVTASPSGDGTAYTANSVFATAGTDAALPSNEYAVYQGSGTTVTVTSLTNLTNYCFTIFSRVGTEWSAGVSDCVTPSANTILEPGDLAILALNANNSGSCGGGAADDEISFVCFRDIRVGMSLEFTDNGWERCNSGQWGNTEGTMRMTRSTGSTITAGTVITVYMDDSEAAMANRFTVLSPTDGTWTFTEINFSEDFNMNAGADQVWFMQGGTWTDGTSGSHDATYDGNILYGFNTKSTWAASCATNPTQNSNLYETFDCISMAPTSVSDFNKYTGPLTSATQREWISRIGDQDNWTNYSNCSGFYAGAPDYNSGFTLAIDLGGFDHGEWSGTTSTDWFDCNNWESLRIPSQTTNVTLPSSGVTFEPLIATTGALTNTLDLETGRTLTINGTGTLTSSGHFTNNATLTHTAGTVTFNGTSAQTLGGTSGSTFQDLTIINTSSTGVTITKPTTVNGVFTLTDGNLLTTSANILTLNDGATASSGSAASFVDGPKIKVGDDAFTFPTGDGTRWARIGISDPGTDVTTTYRAEYFGTAHASSTVTGILNNVSIKEYWTLDQTVTTDDVLVKLYWEDDVFSGIDDCDVGAPDDLRVGHWNGSAWEVNVDGVNYTGTCAAGPDAGTV
ncbi:MAG: hypothetical protein JKX73_06590, partial [Flavobacteriales bacterium]|nr:hypothetical protein [Flavobacteriales bacterium]